MLLGFWMVDDEMEAPGNDQSQAIGLPVETSVKLIQLPAQIPGMETEKLATGKSSSELPTNRRMNT